MKSSNEEITQLKKLILDDRFVKLKSYVNQEINLMSILNIAHKELQHSNFLAWLFDPNESHNKEEYFIREFIKLYFKENNYSDLGVKKPLSVFNFAKLDLSDITILREYKNIDLLIISEKNKLIICIENKIFAKEGEGQLTKYRKFVESNYEEYDFRIYIYLSLFEQEISEEEQEHYVSITYDHIINLLKNSLENSELSENVRFVISQYITSLKVIMNDNSEIELIAKELYQDYKTSFDLVWKYINPSSLAKSKLQKIPNELVSLIKNHPELEPAPTTNSYIRFKPKKLIELKKHFVNIGLIKQEHDLKNQSLFWFEFNVRYNMIQFRYLIGQHDDQIARQRIYNNLSKNLDVFPTLKSDLTPQWKFCRTFMIVTKEEFEKYSSDESLNLDTLIEERFNILIDEIIPEIMTEIEKIK